MRQKGSMTIAMCMMLSVMLGIVAAGIKLCREQYARVQAVNAADTGLYSVFSEYERDLLEEYDLFFLDSGYGRGAIDAYHVVQQMENSMALTLKSGIRGSRQESCSITGYRLATDNGGGGILCAGGRSCQGTSGHSGCQTPEGVFRQYQRGDRTAAGAKGCRCAPYA